MWIISARVRKFCMKLLQKIWKSELNHLYDFTPHDHQFADIELNSYSTRHQPTGQKVNTMVDSLRARSVSVPLTERGELRLDGQ